MSEQIPTDSIAGGKPVNTAKLKRKCLMEIHIAAIMFGLAGLFGKLITWPSIIIVLGRVFFASIFLLIILSYLKQDIKLGEKKDYKYLVLQGIILAVHWWTFYQSVQVSTVAIALVTYSTFPMFVTFMEPFFFKEGLKRVEIITAVITFIGVILVVPSLDFGNNMTQGAFWGIASGFTFAVLSILNRKYAKKYSSLLVAFYQDLAATIVLLPFLFMIQPAMSVSNLLLVLVLGVVLTAVSHTLFIDGLTQVKVQTASIIASLEPVYGIIFAFFLVGEVPGLRVLTGGLTILGAAFYSTVKS